MEESPKKIGQKLFRIGSKKTLGTGKIWSPEKKSLPKLKPTILINEFIKSSPEREQQSFWKFPESESDFVLLRKKIEVSTSDLSKKQYLKINLNLGKFLISRKKDN